MVYCSKCGTLNPDTALNCSNCGAPLAGLKADLTQGMKDEGTTKIMVTHRGGGVGLLIAGLFIILIGLAAFAGFTAFWNISGRLS